MKEWQFEIIIGLLLAILATQMTEPFPFGVPLLLMALVCVILGFIEFYKEEL